MRPADLARHTLTVAALVALIAASLWILKPFLGATVWATMVVVATWPLMRRVEAAAGGRRWVAVTVMTLALLLLFAVPLAATLVTLADNADRIAGWVRWATTWEAPETAPAWLAGLPFVGERIALAWEQAVAAGLAGLLQRLQPYAGSLTRWFVGEVGSVGFVMLNFLMTVAIAGVLYAQGEEAARQVRAFASKLGGDKGERTVLLAGDAIRGVALGVGVTAIVQAALGGLGLAIAGIPFAGLLTAVMFVLCIAQVGALPVLVPAAIWLFWQGEIGWGLFLAVWSAVVGTLDNVLRPWLIRLGADLPLLLIFAGVIGGMVAFGLVGIFVGPVLLAVAWTLFESWIGEQVTPTQAAETEGREP